VVLVPYPFVERDASKRRPAVVVSADSFNTNCPDVIVAPITSKARVPPRPGDHKIADWRGAGLIGPSMVRSRLSTLHYSRVVKPLGRLSPTDIAGIDERLRAALGLG
jgi:mRNA interferase MazF